MKATWIKRGLGTGLLGAGLALGCNHAGPRLASAMPSRTDMAARAPGYGTGITTASTTNKPATGTGDTQVASNKTALDSSASPLAIPGKVDMPKEAPTFPPAADASSTPGKDPAKDSIVQQAGASESNSTAPKVPWETSTASTPAPKLPGEADVVSTSASKPQPEAAAPATPTAPAVPEETRPANPNYGHAEDYSWVMGQLQYSRIRNTWRLRYAQLDESDQYGGSVTLADDLRNAGFHDGQLVRIDGRLIDATSRSIAPTYEVDSIRPMDK
jgi:hypothetical protein